MSCYGFADSFLFIECADKDQRDLVMWSLQGNQIFYAEINPDSPLVIDLCFQDSEVNRNTDAVLERFARDLKETFGLNISGHFIADIDNSKYRHEFNADGKIHWAIADWLLGYSIEQINELHDYAIERFSSEAEHVELRCPSCRKAQPVTARMTHLEYCQANVLADREGRCELDWDSADISGDFEYVCEYCGQVIANCLDQVEELLKAEKNNEK